MLNPAGLLTEASNSNVVFVIDGKLVTPSVESGVLRGITKAAIARFGEEIGCPLREVKLPSAQLSKATECFATSATREVMPVASVRLESGEWQEFPAGGGEITRQVAKAYKDFVSRYVAENASLRLL
jgi:branched-subunit amino acid aminotransferase/4-amino-4-deoxychorismate lyase